MNLLFSIFIFSAPLCGGEVVRVEVQNVGNILFSKPVVLVDCGHAVNELNHLQHVTTARKPVAHVRPDTIRIFLFKAFEADIKLALKFARIVAAR